MTEQVPSPGLVFPQIAVRGSYAERTKSSRQIDGHSRLSVEQFCKIIEEPADIEWMKQVNYLNLPALYSQPNQKLATAVVKETFEVQERLRYVTAITPLVEARELVGYIPGLSLFLKDETQQETGSYKLRGAFNMLSQLSPAARARGVLALSAGNHAAGVAHAAVLLDIEAHVGMPETAPDVKISRVQKYGIEPILRGQNYSDLPAEFANFEHQGKTPVLIPPFDDHDIMYGQGSMAYEARNQYPGTAKFHVLGAGGGGGVGGVARAIKSVEPNSIIIAVEPQGSDALTQSLQQGQLTELNTVDCFVDATAVKKVGRYSLDVCKQYVDASIIVSNSEIAQAVIDLHKFGIKAEAAGALAIAGIRKLACHGRLRGDVIGYITGGNIDAVRLSEMRDMAAGFLTN